MLSLENTLAILLGIIAFIFSLVGIYQSSSKINLIRGQHEAMYSVCYQLCIFFSLIESITRGNAKIDDHKKLVLAQLIDLKSAISEAIKVHLWDEISGTPEDRKTLYNIILFIMDEEIIQSQGNNASLYNYRDAERKWKNLCVSLKELTDLTIKYMNNRYNRRYFPCFNDLSNHSVITDLSVINDRLFNNNPTYLGGGGTP